ncbi:YrzI family small protein [Bacillus andreraoultii]|nr:YrzI family small protein [Bacillus andreraoultii]
MTINILFLTITINKREITLEKVLNDQRVEKLFEESREHAAKYIRY